MASMLAARIYTIFVVSLRHPAEDFTVYLPRTICGFETILHLTRKSSNSRYFFFPSFSLILNSLFRDTENRSYESNE